MTSSNASTHDATETILIIEDEPTERMLARANLERAGYRVLEAGDGPGGLEMARRHHPDLIILDIHLPTTNGFEICREIRAAAKLSQIPILISTGLEDTEDVADGFEAGASDFLTKPTIWALLSFRVKFLLRSAAAERDLAAANQLARVHATALVENERHYRDLFNHAPVMMHRIDEHFRIQDVNRAWLAKTGYSKEEVIGRDFVDFLDQQTKRQLSANGRLNFIETGSVVDLSCRIQRKDDTIIDALMTSTGEFNGKRRFLGAHTVLLDVTERMRAEQKMREAQETAEAASRAKSVFLTTMSHEIRTPLNGVIGMIDLLEQTELDTDQASMIGTVRESAYSLLQIIGDILDFSKIEAGELKIEQIGMSVANVVESVSETLAPLATDKSVQLNVFTSPEIPDVISGDPVRIRQILFNLVGNAIKFSGNRDDRPAEVNVKALLALSAADAAPVVRFTVSDTAMGISEEHIARLFTPFFQAEDSTVRRFGGTGLGLSICKNVVDLMDGTIRVDSELGKGSTFTVDLPLKIAEGATDTPPQQLDGLRILLVALDEASWITAESYLMHDGAQVVAADSLKDAGKSLAAAAHGNDPFDVAIFSHSRPQSVDAENKIIASLRDDPAAANVQFIILSEDRRNRTQAVLPNATLKPKRPLSRSALSCAVLDACGRPREESESSRAPKSMTMPGRSSEPISGLILVAEDNTINQIVIQRQLRTFGYIADVVSDGVEALNAYDHKRYRLLLTDCHMPEMDGFELAQAIRERERGTGQRIPIVAITANALEGEADRCISSGMDDYLTKPVELEKLGLTIEKWLKLEPLPDQGQNPCTAAAEAAQPEPASPDETPPETTTTGGAEHGNPIDFAMLGRLLGTDDSAYLKEIIAVYWDTMRDTLEEITNHFAARNAPALRDAAHAAKGASASVGAVPVSSLLKNLQSAATGADWEQINSLMPEIETAFLNLERYIGDIEAA